MSASYPSAVKVFAARSNGQTIDAAHVGDLQDEVSAIEDGILNGTAPITSSNARVNNLQVAGGSTFVGNSTFTGNVAVGGTLTAAGVVTAAAQPRCHLTSSGTQSIAANSTTVLTFDVEVFDVGGLHSTASNPSRVTIPVGSSGLYMVQATIFVNTLSTFGSLHLLRNSSREYSYQWQTGSAAASFPLTATMVLDGGDFVEVAAVTAATSTLSVGVASSNFYNRFMVTKLW